MSDHNVTAKKIVEGGGEAWFDCLVQGPTSYDSGGSVADLATAADDLGINVDLANMMIVTQPSDTYIHSFVAGTTPDNNAANCKIKWNQISDGAEPSGDLSTISFRARFRVFNKAGDA